ncbi:major facilitator superfamily domain containing 6 like [Rhinolophus ferrumequinum]|uniref:Major facilitator superfamily domain containing 6 like n=1 Tax=Rhinolophus ferrumequinum TaxID=59479 RepID=A0A7J7TEU7_RHIFE|nr:major facilitator superfamily domain containing 6 like [Rhinolophus ferrumequinum]
MSANPQWDISRALGVARLFHVVCGVRDACVTPFLTLYLRQLGLAAPWVGILMGTKHLIAAFWAPFCAFLAKSFQKRRALLIGSLLGSVGASLLMVLVPPLDKDLGYRSCNGSRSVTTTVRPPGVVLTVNFTLAPEPASNHPAGAPSLPARRSIGIRNASGFRKGPGASVQEPFSYLPSYFVSSAEGARTTSGVHPITSGVKDASREGAFKVVSTALPLLAEGPVLGSPANLSATNGDTGALDLSLEGLRWTLILSLGAMAFWELLTAPLERVADDSLYEYLDFVDATDRYRNLWIWRLLGMSAGVCGIAALVGQLDCFLMPSGPRGVLHFYGYSLVSTLALLKKSHVRTNEKEDIYKPGREASPEIEFTSTSIMDSQPPEL